VFHAFSEGFSYCDGYRFRTKSAVYAECKDYERNMFLERIIKVPACLLVTDLPAASLLSPTVIVYNATCISWPVKYFFLLLVVSRQVIEYSILLPQPARVHFHFPLHILDSCILKLGQSFLLLSFSRYILLDFLERIFT